MKPADNVNNNFRLELKIEDARWQQAFSELYQLADKAINAAVKAYCPNKFTEVSLLFTNNENMQKLNKIYRNKNKPTNVLSFPALGVQNLMLGDIAMAYETVMEEAEQAKLAPADHLAHLLVHGYLHLQGLDHLGDEQALFMQALEGDILAKLDIANPYSMEKM